VLDTATTNAPLLVFADDWGRHPSSCQHIIRQLLGRRAVYWVNTIGTRAPRLDRATLTRGLEKLRHWVRPQPAPAPWGARLTAPGPRVLNPRMWPWFGSRLSRRLNRALLRRQLLPLIRSLPEPPVAVTVLPIVADLVGQLPVRRWVYYCVDDFGQWPGLDQEPLRRMDDLLIDRADVLVAVSEVLRERMRARGREAHLLTHGVDLDFWSGGGSAEIPGLAALERPFVVFWGVLDRRMDVPFVRQLAADLQRGTILLVGPEADPDPALFQSPRVVRLGKLPYEQLPRLARETAVLIMPYADLPATRAMQPLKLKEYLATGKPAVARILPATRPWGDCLDLVDTPQAFAAAVRRRLAEGLPPDQARARDRLSAEGWAAKARALERWALGPEPGPGDAHDS
jgi:glycosyltransferase involved in cell wall biosynthesis